jgi:hypothetical protein
VEKLKEYSEHLEEMVEERTRELKDAQEQLVRSENLRLLDSLQVASAMSSGTPLVLSVIQPII